MNERKELLVYDMSSTFADEAEPCYKKHEADQVIDAKERRIGRLTKCVNMWHSVNKDLQTKNGILRNRIKELEATISILETPGWVSVKDRLPTENDILFDTDFPFVCLVRLRVSYKTQQCNIEEILEGKFGDFSIIAWMPLPPPPTKEVK